MRFGGDTLSRAHRAECLPVPVRAVLLFVRSSFSLQQFYHTLAEKSRNLAMAEKNILYCFWTTPCDMIEGQKGGFILEET